MAVKGDSIPERTDTSERRPDGKPSGVAAKYVLIPAVFTMLRRKQL
jgi:hypothetical protein